MVLDIVFGSVDGDLSVDLTWQATDLSESELDPYAVSEAGSNSLPVDEDSDDDDDLDPDCDLHCSGRLLATLKAQVENCKAGLTRSILKLHAETSHTPNLQSQRRVSTTSSLYRNLC